MAGPERRSVFDPLPDRIRRKLQQIGDKSRLEDDDNDNDDEATGLIRTLSIQKAWKRA